MVLGVQSMLFSVPAIELRSVLISLKQTFLERTKYTDVSVS